MSKLSQLSPQPLWDIFATICSIPHPSYHEEELAKHVLCWAEKKGLRTERDKAGNILIRKPATAGWENRKTIALQAHLDMVPQKNSDKEHDFTQDAIQPWIDGEWVKACGTTLGADNGIGMASVLAALSDNSLEHGPLEVLLTMTEEVGMEGAFGLQPNWLQADILINTDSEQEGEIYMGCAGGSNAITTLPIEREAIPVGFDIMKLTITGLKGGHSGCDIHVGLGNANKLLVRFLATQAQDLDLRLIDISGGTLRNAIPREAQAVLAVANDKKETLKAAVIDYLATLCSEVSPQDKNINLRLEPLTSHTENALTRYSRDHLIALLNSIPNGVIRYSDTMPGVVETSLNVGVVATTAYQAEITCMIRSLIDSGKHYVEEILKSLSALAGATTAITGDYPGWKPDVTSPIMLLVAQTYEKLFHRTPDIKVIHAGLECGLFKKPYPKLDMVSIGPTIIAPHSPDEQVNIVSVGRYWALLTELLRVIPMKAG